MTKNKIILGLLSMLMTYTLSSQVKELTIPFTNSAAAKKLEVKLFSGKINIKGTDRSDILVKYEILKNEDQEKESGESSKTKGLRKISGQNINFEISEKNNKAIIASQNWMNSIILDLEVPRAIELNISNQVTEEIHIENVLGNINVENSAGSITLLGVSGLVNASTHAGEIKIEFDKIPSEKSMLIHNTTGEIDLTFPLDFKADLKMKTNWGEIYSDLEIETSSEEPTIKREEDDNGFNLSMDTWTYAKLNGGGQEVTIKTQMGNIYLRKKE